jgi:tartrate dehydrogenase/decarboxylase/D-malate dehydrogenase
LNQPDVRPRIAVIPGDGVGPEVVRVARDLMIQAAASVGVTVQTEEFGWGSEHYLAHGRAMPGDAADVLRAYEAVLFGSLGTPSLPDSEVVWSLIELRKQLDLGANVRPVERWPGIPSRFVDGLTADFVVVRENTEGEYSGIGGRSRISNVGNIAIAVAVHSETTIAALARYAFGLARTRRNLLTLISKANAIHHAFSLWEEVVADVATEFSDVRYEVSLVDAAAARMIQNPESFDVLLTSNLFGDVLSEIGSTLQGGVGMAASANVATDGRRPGLFEPIHGSAPDIAGRGIANPIGAVLSAAMLLDHIGQPTAGDRLRTATRHAVTLLRTADLGGKATTQEFGAEIAEHLADPTLHERRASDDGDS